MSSVGRKQAEIRFSPALTWLAARACHTFCAEASRLPSLPQWCASDCEMSSRDSSRARPSRGRPQAQQPQQARPEPQELSELQLRRQQRMTVYQAGQSTRVAAATGFSPDSVKLAAIGPGNIRTGESDWIFQTSATHHVCRKLSLMTDVRRDPGVISVGAGAPERPFQLRGTVRMLPKNTTSAAEVILKDVIYFEDSPCNVLSPFSLVWNHRQRDANIWFTDHGTCFVETEVNGRLSNIIHSTLREDRIYVDLERVTVPTTLPDGGIHWSRDECEA